jgi:hypothetical protein
MIAATDPPAARPWALRHVTKLLVGAGLLLLLDSRTTNLLVEAPDWHFDDTKAGDDTAPGWRQYAANGGRTDKAQVELDRLHARSRSFLANAGATRPDGLDPWLAIVRTRVDERIYLVAEPLVVDHESLAALRPQVDALPGATLVGLDDALQDRDTNCASGLSKAFAEATGASVIVIEHPAAFEARVTPDAPRIAMTWSARANGRLYGGPGDRYVLPGLMLTATLHLQVAGETISSLEAAGDPGASFTFTTYTPSFPFGGEPDTFGITGAMIEAACGHLGRQWIEDLTGLAPPVVKDDVPVADHCRAGDARACLAAAADLRASDPQAALALLMRGCHSVGLFASASCVSAADLALEIGGDLAEGQASLLLQDGCAAHDATACARSATLSLADEGDPTSWTDAYRLRLRACDLGRAQACLDAADQMGSAAKDRPASPIRARVLAARACAAGLQAACTHTADGTREPAIGDVALEPRDAIFDVRWGMWFEGQATEVVWIASPATKAELEQRLASPIATGRVRVHEVTDAPPGVRPPADAVAIFGVIDAPVPDRRACPVCPAGARDNPFMVPSSCTCLPVSAR